MNNAMRYAGIAGVVTMFLEIPIAIFEVFATFDKLTGILLIVDIIVVGLSMISGIFMMYGFKLIADMYKHGLLKGSAYSLIIILTLFNLYFIASVSNSHFENFPTALISLVAVGLAHAFLGGALLSLRSQLGTFAFVAGASSLMLGISFVMVIPAVFGVLLFVPFCVSSSLLFFQLAKSSNLPAHS